MTRFCLMGLLMILGLWMFNACQPQPVDPAAEKVVIEQVIRKSIGWALDKDLEGLYRVMAQDDQFLIINPDSAGGYHEGFPRFKAFAERVFMDPRFQAKSMALRDLRITLSESGTVAWYFCHLDDIAEWDGHPAGWHNIRWTGVVEKRDGQWVHVQQHYSFPADRFVKR